MHCARRRLSCGDCRLFVDDPHELERAFPGILILSFTYGSARGDSGICSKTEIFCALQPACEAFVPREGWSGAVAGGVTEE